MNTKAQISVEFLISIILVMLLFGFALFFYTEKNTEFINVQQTSEAQGTAQKLARTINEIHSAGNGVETKLYLNEIQGFDFNIEVSQNKVRVYWKDNFTSYALTTKNTQYFYGEASTVWVKNENNRIVVKYA